MPALLNESRISIFTFEVTIKISPCFSIKYMYMIFSAESVYSVKTAVVSDGLEDTFSILLGMALVYLKLLSFFRMLCCMSIQVSRRLDASVRKRYL